MVIVDLSKPVRFNKNHPSFMQIKVKPKSRFMAKLLVRFKVKLPKRYFPSDFHGWADDTITKMGVHSTTHIDAPVHYGATCEGKEAEGIEAIPLDKCIGPGIVLNMSHKTEGDPITVDDIKAELTRIDAKVTKGVIVLVRTDRDKFADQNDFWRRGTGMSAKATEWLIDQGSQVMGIDQWGWDVPFQYHVARSKKENRDDLFWEAHRVGLRKRYWHMEQLTNLSSLPPKGFTVYVAPLKLVGASASPARIIAILDE